MVDKKKTEIKPKVVKVSSESNAAKSFAKRSPAISHGVGRRKKAVARVWLSKGSGKIAVNNVAYADYFDTPYTRQTVLQPMNLIEAGAGYDVRANVVGGGKSGQADAISLGIARAMVRLDAALKPVLRKSGLITVDSRIKERKKYGQKAARRKFQFVKR